MAWATIVLAALGLWTLSTAYSVTTAYRKARQASVSVFVLPLNSLNPFWLIFGNMAIPYLKRVLPERVYNTVSLATWGFEFQWRASFYDKAGPVAVLVTSGATEFNVAEPELVMEILRTSNKDFFVPEMTGVIMDIFGPSMLTCNGASWSRQRKLIAPMINEKISGIVFGESARQATEMMASYVDDAGGLTGDAVQGLKQIAINVLGTGSFGLSLPWKPQRAKPSGGYRLTYMEATRIIIDNLFQAALMPTWIQLLPIFPDSWRAVGHAKREFPLHTRDMLENERRVALDSATPRNNLMSMLVRLTDASHAKAGDPSDGGAQVLSGEEVRGNLFIFTVAGFDTTANTMAYALGLVAAHPEWQDWLYDEIRHVVGDRDVQDLEYADSFPRLPRCLALMLETLRLFPPVVHTARTPQRDVTLTTSNGRTYMFPAKVTMHINIVALHLHPGVWGSDAGAFRPSRWLVDPDLAPGTPSYSNANVRPGPKGAFVPWSAGPRACPGQKMSQVEFVTVFMTIFARFRCTAVRLHETETDAERSRRVEQILADSAPRVALQMNHPEALELQWLRR